MNNEKRTNIPVMSVGRMIDKLSIAYCSVINNSLPIRTVPSVMLWGPPGVGKSQAVRQIGENIEEGVGKKVIVTDVRLLLFNPIDLRGIPTANAEKTLAIWLKPQIFQMDPDENVINILFLDEISAAPQSVQAAAYQITLDRVIGEHRLPDNCIVIAAGNRVTDKSVAYKMPKALANRLMHIEVKGDFEAWKEWAVVNGINDKVIGYLSYKQSHLMEFNATDDYLAFPTPRSWEMVSNILNGIDNDIDNMYDLIAGIIGLGVAAEFRIWSKIYKDLPCVEDIFDGKNPRLPTDINAICTLAYSMITYAREHKDDMTRIANSIRYANTMPPDYSSMIMKNYMLFDKSYKQRLLQIPEFANWLGSKGSIMNGSF